MNIKSLHNIEFLKQLALLPPPNAQEDAEFKVGE
jgi:hypothetical protein